MDLRFRSCSGVKFVTPHQLLRTQFRFDSMRRSLTLPMRGVISELFRLLAEERYEIPGPLIWRKERNDDLP